MIINVTEKLLSLSFLFLLLSICGCSGPSVENELVGKWLGVEEKDMTEFFDDGTFTSSVDKKQVAGKWKVLEDGKIKMDLSMMGVDMVFTGVITNDELRITFGDMEDILVKEGSSAYEKILVELENEKKKSNEIIAKIKQTFKDSLWQCGGDTWYGSAKLWASDYLVELKDPDVNVEQKELTEAHKANGIEWRGVVQPISKLYRKNIKNAWSEWYDGTDGVVLFQSSIGMMGSGSFYVESINGQSKWKPELPKEKWACTSNTPGVTQDETNNEFLPNANASKETGARLASGVNSDLVGSWKINANNYEGKLEVSEKKGKLSGRMYYDVYKKWEPLSNVSFDGKILKAYRPGASQQYTGQLSGNSISGTFTYQGGTYNWNAEKM